MNTLNIHARNHKYAFLLYVAIFLLTLFAGNPLKAQPKSFKKGVYMTLTTESSFVMYNNVSYNTMDCINLACKKSYIDGITFKILWKDVTVDSSTGQLSFRIYKQELSQLMKAVIGYNKAVGVAVYAGAFTPPAVLNAMPPVHVLRNIRLATQSGGPCLTDTLVTSNLYPGTYDIPAAWDKVYKSNFTNIMRLLSNYLVQNNITLSYVIFTGINEYSAETRMPNDIIETRDSKGNITYFQNDYVLWKNAGLNGNSASASINQTRTTFDLFLNNIYDKYAAFKNTVLCVQSMGATAEFPKVPKDTSKNSFTDSRSVNYFSCAKAYDTTSDVFAAMLSDIQKARQPQKSFATMYCSMNEIYGNGLDYVGIVNNTKGDNTELCRSLKGYHLRDVEFIRGNVAPSKVAKPFADDFTQALYNSVQYGAQFVELFPYDVYAAEQDATPSIKTEFQQALNFTHQQLTTASPDYDGYPATTVISDTSSGIDSIGFSIPVLPGVVNYSWQLDGLTLFSGTTLSRLALPKLLIAIGSHLISVKYSSNCGTKTATLNYSTPAVFLRSLNDGPAPNTYVLQRISSRSYIISFTLPVQDARILVFDMAGRMVLNFTASGSQANLNLENASSGLYIVKIIAPGAGINGATKISLE